MAPGNGLPMQVAYMLKLLEGHNCKLKKKKEIKGMLRHHDFRKFRENLQWLD